MTVIWIAVFYHWSVNGLAIAHVISIITVFVTAFFAYTQLLFDYKTYQLHKAIVSNFIKRGLLFLPSQIASFFVIIGPRFILCTLTTLSNVGIFVCADAINQLYDLVIIQSLQSSYIPFMMR